MSVVDAFPGNNEISLAEFRIYYLSPIVDFTVIAESTLTHSGRIKPLFFTQWLKENLELQDKVHVLELDLTKYKDPWSREIATRESLLSFIVREFPDSHFVISDLDEIPSREQIQAATSVRKTFHFLTPTVYLNANWHLKDSHANWSRGVVGHSSMPPKENGGRFEKLPILRSPSGLHFSWFTESSDSILKKVESSAHTELADAKLFDSALIQYASRYGIDHLGRFHEKGFGLLEIRGVDELSPLQIHLLEWNGEFFTFRLEKGFIVKRYFASLICTLMWQNSKSREICLKVVNGQKIPWRSKSYFVLQLILQFSLGIAHLARRVYRKITANWLS
jgi:hypothetical protein